MKFKKKKLLLTIGTATLIGMTAIATVSCNNETKFDQQNDGIIKIALGWDPKSNQAKSLQKLVNMYNQTQKDTEDYMKVEVKFMAVSYEELLRFLEQQIKVKDTTEMYNLAMAYITGLGIVSGYNMQLRFDKTDNDKDKWGLDGSEFEEAFLNFNNNIGGLKPGGVYALPLTKSTPVTAINTPLLSYIFESMIGYGATINEKDKEWFENIIKLGKIDRQPVINELGNPVELEKSNYENGKFVLSRDIFNTGSTLIDFAVKVQQLFEKSRDNPKGSFHALAIEDISNFISAQVFSMTAQEAHDFKNYYTKIGENGFVDYSGYSQKDSESYKKLSELASTIIKASKTGAIYIGNTSCCTGNFPAYQFRRHQIALSIGSSSNYSLNYYGSSSDLDTYSINIDKNGDKLTKNIGDANIFYVTQVDDSTTAGTIANITSNGKHGTLLKSTNKNFSTSNIVLFDKTTDSKVEDFVREIFESPEKGVIMKGYKELNEIWYSQKQKLESAGLKLLGKSAVMKDGKFVEDENIYGLLNSDLLNNGEIISLKKLSNDATLQESELVGINSPRKWSSKNKVNATYVQGASMIGIHSNAEENKATRKFVHWLTNGSENAYKYLDPVTKQERYKLASDITKFTDNIDEALKTKPLKFLYLASPYIVPYKGVFDENTTGATKFATIALNEFRQAANKENKEKWSLVEEPTDSTTSQFRSVFISAWRNPIIRILEGQGSNVTNDYETEIKKNIDLNKNSFSY